MNLEEIIIRTNVISNNNTNNCTVHTINMIISNIISPFYHILPPQFLCDCNKKEGTNCMAYVSVNQFSRFKKLKKIVIMDEDLTFDIYHLMKMKYFNGLKCIYVNNLSVNSWISLYELFFKQSFVNNDPSYYGYGWKVGQLLLSVVSAYFLVKGVHRLFGGS